MYRYRIPTNALGRPIYEHDLHGIHERLREARTKALQDDGTGVRLPAQVSTAAFLSTLVELSTGVVLSEV